MLAVNTKIYGTMGNNKFSIIAWYCITDRKDKNNVQCI